LLPRANEPELGAQLPDTLDPLALGPIARLRDWRNWTLGGVLLDVRVDLRAAYQNMDAIRLSAAEHPLTYEVEVFSFSERRVVLINPFVVGAVAVLKLVGELGM